MNKKHTRGAVTKAGANFLGAYVPKEIVDLVDLAVRQEDTDRSKFIRSALREKLVRQGRLQSATA
jgi:metal-responsive CopG/Arc/MetJ family transcriptional regulator